MLENYLFNRRLKAARKKFRQIAASSVYNEMPRLKRRGLVKAILRGAGFKRIRMIEKAN